MDVEELAGVPGGNRGSDQMSKAITVGNITIPWHKSRYGAEGWPLPGMEITRNVDRATQVAAAISRMSKPVPPLPEWRLAEIISRL
jgi:hypothetical protein